MVEMTGQRRTNCEGINGRTGSLMSVVRAHAYFGVRVRCHGDPN
jgi:hypothetical protein